MVAVRVRHWHYQPINFDIGGLPLWGEFLDQVLNDVNGCDWCDPFSCMNAFWDPNNFFLTSHFQEYNNYDLPESIHTAFLPPWAALPIFTRCMFRFSWLCPVQSFVIILFSFKITLAKWLLTNGFQCDYVWIVSLNASHVIHNCIQTWICFERYLFTWANWYHY